MKTLKLLRNSLVVMVILTMLWACSKDSEHPPGNQNLKNSGIGDKVFTGNPSSKSFAWDNLDKMFTNNDGQKDFTQYGGNSFANNTPGSGGGGSLPTTGSGSLLANNTTIPLIFGAYLSYGEGDFDLYLLNQAVTLEGDEYPGLSGIIFEVISPSPSEIKAGEYQYSEDYTPYTFPYASVGINTSTDNEIILDVVDGTLNISKNGDSYTIHFSGILENDSPFSGTFSGTLVAFDDNQPPPPSQSSLSASIDGNTWNTDLVYGYSDGSSAISITGVSAGGEQYLGIELNYSMVSIGAQLSLQNDGVYSIIYSDNSGYYSATESANVSITSYNGSEISGTFNFIGTDFMDNSINVTNGSFQNVAIQFNK